MVRQNSAGESTQNNSQNPAFNTNGLTHHMEQAEHRQETPKELSDSQIFEKIAQAMREHTPGGTSSVRYDVQDESIYKSYHSGNRWEQGEDGYCPYEIFTLEKWCDDYDILRILGEDPDFDDKEILSNSEKVELFLKNISIEDWGCYDEIVYEIEEARKYYADFLESQK